MQTADWLFMMKCNAKVPGRPFCSGSSQARLGLQAIAIVGSTAKIHSEQKNLMMKTAAAAAGKKKLAETARVVTKTTAVVPGN